MIYESRFSLNGYYRVAGIGEIANDIKKNGEWVNAINERGETPLHIAAKYKKFDLLKTMLPYFSKIEACDNQGNTVMHALLDNNSNPSKNEKKCSELIEILMGKGGQVNKKNRTGWTPVHLAARNCQIEVLHVLEKAKPDFSLRVENGETILHLACKNMSNLVDTPTEMEIINNLVIHGCDVNAKNDKGYSVVHYAVEYCGVRVVEKLIDCGAELNCHTDNLQLTPLHLAVRRKNSNIIDALLKAGANVNNTAQASLTSLQLAVIMGSLDAAKILIDNNADVDHRVDDQWSALHMSIYLKRKDMFKLLVREHANVDIHGVDDLTPLHLASMLGNFKFVKSLVDNGAQVNSRDKNNFTPLHLSIKDFHRSYLSRHIESNVHAYLKDKQFAKYFVAFLDVSVDRDHKIVSKYLLDNGADVNAMTKDNESALHFAAETGNVKLVKNLLKHGANVDCRDKLDGFTPLHTATYWNHADVVKELVNANADLTVTSNDGKSAIHLAAFYNRVGIIKEFVHANVDVNITTRHGKSALHLATFLNHVDVVRELLNCNNVDVNIRAEDGKSPLHLAVEKNNGKVFKLLYKNGAGVSGDDKRLRNSPLHVAARENNEQMIEYLIKFGCKVNAANEDGFTPLHCAVDKCNVKATESLIELDADVNLKTKRYQLTALHLALQRKCYATAELLIDSGAADVNVADSDGVTPLHLATLCHQMLVTKLLCRGADVHCADKILQFSPLHIAVNEKNEDMLLDLIEAGADVNVSDRYGLTPLHLATILGNCSFVEALIDYGANVNCRDVNMYTPLHLAICNKRVMAKISARIYSNENSWISKSLNKSHEFRQENYDDLVEFFVQLGADLNAVTKYGESLLHFAAEANAVDFINILMENEFDVNLKDRRSGMTPLQTAVLNDHKETVVLLISRGADVNVLTNCGKSLLHLATESGGTRVLEFLLPSNNVVERCPFIRNNSHCEMKSFEFDVNTKDYFGMTPLHLAALQSNRKRATEILLIYGASVNAQDNYGFLPIHYAIKNNRHQQLECLLAFGIDVNDFKVYSKIELDKIGYNTTVGVRMIQHLIKLKALEFPVATVYESILRDLRYTEDIYYHECLKEIEKLRVNFVGRGVSLYNLLHIKRRGRRIYAKNIEPRVIEREFPIYYSLILDVYHKIIVREDLMKKAEFALYQLTEIDLPVVCTDKIFHYLGIVSLVTLIKAAEIKRKNNRRKLSVEMKNMEKNHLRNLLYALVCKVLDVCERAKETILTFVWAVALFFSSVPRIFYSIFNKWT